jgi:GNAT superfamily N-acetyltransferase
MTSLPKGYQLTEDPHRIDPVATREYLARSYWSPGIPLATVERAIKNSLCVAIFHEDKQVAFARAVTDRATFAYLADVSVLEVHRKTGLSQTLVRALYDHRELAGIRRWTLFTVDAHGLYQKLGWQPLAHPERGMEIVSEDIYSR